MRALEAGLKPEYIHLDDEAIRGRVVSSRFEGVPARERVRRVASALEAGGLSPAERVAIGSIMPLTPAEFSASGRRIAVKTGKTLPDGWFSLVVKGSATDAEYVKDRLSELKGVAEVASRDKVRSKGPLRRVVIRGEAARPLPQELVLRFLGRDQFIRVKTRA